MERYAPYIELPIVLVLGVFIVFLSVSAPVQKSSSSVATTTSAQAVVTSPKKIATATTSSSVSKLSAPTAGNASEALRSALVNIICYAPPSGNIKSISGSGIIVSPQGMILTTAHIAQYFLLTDRGISCTIRAGAPATDRYKASLAYISPLWVKANADVLTQTSPIGTGEHDFALLAITESTNTTPLPVTFSFVPLAVTSPTLNASVVIVSYGSQSLAYDQLRSALFYTTVASTVKEVFTFGIDTIDVLALGGSDAAQTGSSGGGVADASGHLIATLTTSTVDGDTNTRSLHAITTSYIRRDYERETGQSLGTLFSQPISTSVAAFAPKISPLEALITAHLP